MQRASWGHQGILRPRPHGFWAPEDTVCPLPTLDVLSGSQGQSHRPTDHEGPTWGSAALGWEPSISSKQRQKGSPNHLASSPQSTSL